jgi:putative membrane protein
MNKTHLALFCIALLVLGWSVIQPHDYLTWGLESFPGIIGLAVLVLTYKKFKFTTFVYVLIAIHCCILFVGGKYTYALNPLFEWLKQVFSQERNNYDKVGHFAQGFIPSLIAREILIRFNIVQNRKWAFFICLSIVMFISSSYELLEWFVSVATGSAGDAFLGTQGDIWDTQSDMLYAFIGSSAALILFSGYHDRKIMEMA